METQEPSQVGEAQVLLEAEALVHVFVLGERSSSIHGSPKKYWIHVVNVK